MGKEEKLNNLNDTITRTKSTAGIDFVACSLGVLDVLLNIGNVTMMVIWTAFSLLFLISGILNYKKYKKTLSEYVKLKKEYDKEKYKDDKSSN